MKTLIGLFIIAVLALFGARVNPRKIPSSSSPIKAIIASGLIFLFIGLALGPQGLGFITEEVTNKLSSVVTIGLFWIGFLFGINFKGKDLKRLRRPVYMFAVGQSVFTFAVVFITGFLLIRYAQPSVGVFGAVAASITLAACASGTGQATLLRLRTDRSFRGATAQVATVTATLDDLPAVLAAGMLTFFWHTTAAGQTSLAGLGWMLVALSVSLFGAWAMRLLVVRSPNDKVLFLTVLGCMSVGGGLAAYLHLSPIFIGFVMGVILVNITIRNDRLFDILHRSEATLYILFLLLVGSMMRVDSVALIWLVALYVALRAAAKIIGVMLFRYHEENGMDASPLTGLALLSQGGMAVAIAFHYREMYASILGDTVLTMVLLGAAVNEMIASPLALWTVRRQRK